MIEAEILAISAKMILEGYNEALEKQYEINRQEALSVVYAHSLRLVRLSTGAWAVFDSGRSLLVIMQSLDEQELAGLYEAEVRGYDARKVAEARGQAPQVTAVASPEDLGL